MIQRIQTIFLFLASLIMFLMLSNPIAQINVSEDLTLIFVHYKIYSIQDADFSPISAWPVTFLIFVTIIIGFVTIFLYKRRTLQMRLCVFNIILLFGLVGLIYFFTKYTLSDMEGVSSFFEWPVVIPFIAIVLNYLAFKRIQKDEILIKSYERLR